MKRILPIVLVAATVLASSLVASADTSSDPEKIEFRVNIFTTEDFIDRTQTGCRYGSGAQNLHIRSESGDYELAVVHNGTWIGIREVCRFSQVVALDVTQSQSFTFGNREWFTVTPEEMDGQNRIDIQMTGVQIPEYELQTVGIVKTVAPTPTPDPETVFTIANQETGAESIETARFANGNSGYLFTEPWDMTVSSYSYNSVEAAEQAFPEICGHIKQQTENLKHEASASEVSLGRIGDDICAFLDGEDRVVLFTAVRVGDQILTTFAFASDGDTVGFVGEWLEGYISSIPDDPDTLMPSLADMPRGWTQSSEPRDAVMPVATP